MRSYDVNSFVIAVMNWNLQLDPAFCVKRGAALDRMDSFVEIVQLLQQINGNFMTSAQNISRDLQFLSQVCGCQLERGQNLDVDMLLNFLVQCPEKIRAFQSAVLFLLSIDQSISVEQHKAELVLLFTEILRLAPEPLEIMSVLEAILKHQYLDRLNKSQFVQLALLLRQFCETQVGCRGLTQLFEGSLSRRAVWELVLGAGINYDNMALKSAMQKKTAQPLGDALMMSLGVALPIQLKLLILMDLTERYMAHQNEKVQESNAARAFFVGRDDKKAKAREILEQLQTIAEALSRGVTDIAVIDELASKTTSHQENKLEVIQHHATRVAAEVRASDFVSRYSL